MGGLRAVGLHAVRPPGRAAARRRPGQVGRRGPRTPREVPERAPTRATPSSSATTPPIRAFKDDVLAHLGTAADRRPLARRSTPASARTCPTTRRRARCAAATSRPRSPCRGRKAADDDGTFKSAAPSSTRSTDELGLTPTTTTVAYCRIGERSSHTWFVLTHLLGFEQVRNYDGSWTEWGNAVRVPIAVGRRARRGAERRRHDRACRARRDGDGLRRHRRARTSCSCCWSSRTTCRRCPPVSKRRRMEPVARVPVAAVPARRRRGPTTHVRLFFHAPAEAPTTRGFASILPAGLDGRRRPTCWPSRTTSTPLSGWASVVSPLRLRGMAAMLARIKRRLREGRR